MTSWRPSPPSGSLKSRAHHTWDDRIRDAVQYMRTLNARDVAVVVRAPEVEPEDKELVVQIIQLDSRNDHVGVFAYLSNGPYEETDALFALDKLLTSWHYRVGLIVAGPTWRARNKQTRRSILRGDWRGPIRQQGR